jgi:hypothetical protein
MVFIVGEERIEIEGREVFGKMLKMLSDKEMPASTGRG